MKRCAICNKDVLSVYIIDGYYHCKNCLSDDEAALAGISNECSHKILMQKHRHEEMMKND